MTFGSKLLRIKPQVWEVDDDIEKAIGGFSDSSMDSTPQDQEKQSDFELINDEQTDEDHSGPYRDDGKDVGLCVPRKNCANRDGAGLIEPRKNRCHKSKVFCSVDDLEDYPMCGISRPNLIHDRILSTSFNSNSAVGEWPWLAIVTEVRDEDDWYLCNAVLIDNRHLVTVAHCFDKSESLDIKVRLGAYELFNDVDLQNSIEIEAEIIVQHPTYTHHNMHNDFAVIRLKHATPFNQRISPICLPSPIEVRKFQVASNRHSARCVTTGWGLNAQLTKRQALSEIPKHVWLPLVEHDRCEKQLRKTKLGKRFELHQSFLCAGAEPGNDSCLGDGGSPLMCKQDDGTFMLVGLVSWGIGCGQPNVPGVYTNVAEFVDFVEKCKEFMAEDDF